MVTGITQAGDERRGPVAQKEEENHAGQNQADEDGVAHAGDGVAHQLRLVVKELELDARRQLLLELGNFAGHGVGHGHGVAGGLRA